MGDLRKKLDELIEQACQLSAKCEHLAHISGVNKLQKQIQAEYKFLCSLRDSGKEVKETQLRSSNLTHLRSVLLQASSRQGVSRLYKRFSFPGAGKEALVVDLVCEEGGSWVKVIARNPQALHLVWAGSGQYGSSSVVDQGEQYLQFSRHFTYRFRPPSVTFVFVCGVTRGLAEALTSCGVHVEGEHVDTSPEIETKCVPLAAYDSSEDGDDSDWLPKATAASDWLKKKVAASDDIFYEGDGKSTDFRQLDDFAEMHKLQELFDGEGSMFTRENPAQVESARDVEAHKVYPADFCDLDCDVRSDIAYCSTGNPVKLQGDNMEKLSFASANALGNSDDVEVHVSGPPHESDSEDIDPFLVNLDITTLIFIVSEVTNGGCYFRFRDEVLNEQATEERKEASLLKVQDYLADKKLTACETAVSDFRTILTKLGGTTEQSRAEELLSRVKITRDNPSPRTRAMGHTSKLKARSKVIFGTGDQLKAITCTANVGFLRAASGKGIHYAAFTHPPRALTEKKQETAEVMKR